MKPLEYFESLRRVLGEAALEEIDKAIELLKACKGTIYVAGNGGSAAIANHFACDLGKGCGLKVQSLSCNVPLITAIANDTNYHEVFRRQLELARFGPEDLFLAVSSSGNSLNIGMAVAWASHIGPVIGLTGFSPYNRVCDWLSMSRNPSASIHFRSDNYGVVEDCHQATMHAIAQALKSS